MNGPRPSGAGPRPVALLVAAGLFLGALGACDTRPAWDREGLGRAYYDVSGDFVHAGVSMRTPPDLPPMDPAELGADTTDPAFDLYRMRCAACHDVPDPKLKTPSGWRYLVDRMREKTATAGLVPMTEAEADSILDLLSRHAKR